MRRPALLALLALAVLAAPAQAAPPVAVMHPCADAPPRALCGSVTVPLDRRGEQPAPDARTLQVEFELYPRRQEDRPSLGTIVSAEGGPGYSTTDSRSYYRELNQPLTARRELLLVDQRGTGLSGPLDCPAFAETVAGLHRARRRLRRAARQPGRLLRHARGGRRPRRRPHRAPDRPDRPVRRQLRLLPRAGVRRAAPDAAAEPRARRHLPAAGHRPGVRRPGRGDPARAAARLPAAAVVRRPRRGPGRRAPAPRPAGPHGTGVRHGHGRRGRAHPGHGRRDVARHRRPVGLRQHRDLARPPGRRARVRAGRSPAAVPARGREHARPDRLAGPQLLRGPLPRGHLPRLPADVGSGGERRRAAAPARPRAGRAPAGPVRALLPRRVDLGRVRGSDGVPGVARSAQARPARPAGRAVPGRADARPERRPGQHHGILGCARRRRALPALHVRRGPEQHPRDGARRPRRLRGPARRPLRRDARRRRHELRAADQGGADRRHVPAHRRGRHAGGAGARRREHAGAAARRRGRRRDRGRRAPALVDQLRRHEPRPARRALELRGRRADDVHVRRHAVRVRRPGLRHGDLGPGDGRLARRPHDRRARRLSSSAGT